MKNPMALLLAVAVLGLGIAGIVFFERSMNRDTWPDARTPALVAGIICESLATGLLVVGLCLFRRRE